MEINFATVASLFVTLAGSILYMSTDLNFSLVGTLLLMANIILAILERLAARRLTGIEPVKMSKSCMTFISNAVGSIPIAVLVVIFGELQRWPMLVTKSLSDYLLLSASCILGIGLGWTAVAVQAHIQATTHMLLTNINKVVVVAFGMLFLHESHAWTSILGVSITIAGGVWYAAARAQIAAGAQAKPPEQGKAEPSAEAKPAVAAVEKGAGSA